MDPVLSVIIPCYNEAARLDPLCELIRREQQRPWEWLFVDDGSTDDTAAKLQALADELPDHVRLVGYEKNRGKGFAVKRGFETAAGDLCGYVDADLAASPLAFDRFLAEPDIRRGESLLVGIRVKTQMGNVKRLLLRHLMGRAFQTYTNVLLGLSVYDTQCGFKLMATEQAREIAARMQIEGFAFDVEVIALALGLGMTVREEMIAWEEKGASSIRPRHVLQMARDILRIRRHRQQRQHYGE